MHTYINNAITALYAANFPSLALVSAMLYAMAILIYRFIGGGVITTFEGRGRRLVASIPLYYGAALTVASVTDLIGYVIMNVTLYFLLMFAIRSPEIGCYYVWRKSTVSDEIIIPRQPTTFYNKFLIERYGFLKAQKIRLVIYPTACVIVAVLLNLFFFAIPLNHEIPWYVGIIMSVIAALIMFAGTYISYIMNTQHSDGYTNIDVESAEYSMGLYISLVAAFMIAAI